MKLQSSILLDGIIILLLFALQILFHSMHKDFGNPVYQVLRFAAIAAIQVVIFPYIRRGVLWLKKPH